jgi:hypothetical protein
MPINHDDDFAQILIIQEDGVNGGLDLGENDFAPLILFQFTPYGQWGWPGPGVGCLRCRLKKISQQPQLIVLHLLLSFPQHFHFAG